MMKEQITDEAPTQRVALNVTWVSVAAALRRLLSQTTEPHILYPTIAIFILSIFWWTTLNLINNEIAAAEHAAAVSSRELAETYEAQVVRALREIDQTLKFVKYAYESAGKRSTLSDLKTKTLLPPDLVFTVSIADNKGDIVASTRPLEKKYVADQEYFQSQRNVDALSVSRPWKNQISSEWQLQFSRRLNASDGSFAGIVMVAVDAAYFVSGYELDKLGEQGALGILGTDGVFRARRSGDLITAGDKVDFAAVVPATDEVNDVKPSINAWDGMSRYTSTRQLYDFPLAIIVGLSEDEQLAAARQNKLTYLWRASAASLLLILIVSVLGRLSRQLVLSRQREVEEQVAHAARVEYLAYHDGLTTLPNRSLFSKLLSQSISHAHRYNRQLAVMFLDLDHFKHVNDTLGHESGDQLLQEVASRLKDCLRQSDTVARLGGDEFVVLLPELEKKMYISTVAQKILSAIAKPFILRGDEYRVTTSIGISIYPQDGLDEQTLTKNADIAMYQAKEEGKNNFQFYSEKLHASSLERLTLESGLRHALEHHEFELHYQAMRDMRSGMITGMEAVLRWRHPDIGMVTPMRFVAIAEEMGLMVPIGKWVLKTACLQNVAWQKQGLPRLKMAVNLTIRQFFDENLLADLTKILVDTGMEATLLELEITESLLMRDAEKTMRVLIGLKNMGIRIAIDDFGIGYSSLATLKQFPIDTIKIDRSLIRDIASVDEDKEMTKAIVAMGRTLSLTVVAQGVETKEQAEYLRQSACDELQGFYLNRPVPADQVAELLLTQSAVSDTDTNPIA